MYKSRKCKSTGYFTILAIRYSLRVDVLLKGPQEKQMKAMRLLPKTNICNDFLCAEMFTGLS